MADRNFDRIAGKMRITSHAVHVSIHISVLDKNGAECSLRVLFLYNNVSAEPRIAQL